MNDFVHSSESVEQATVPDKSHPHEVTVIVDGQQSQPIRQGQWIVRNLKRELGLENRNLFQEIGDTIIPLDNDSKLEIRGGEVFTTTAKGSHS